MKKYLFIVYVTAISCQKTMTTNNSANDVKVAKEITTDFYDDLMKLDTLKIYNYLDAAISEKQFSEEVSRKFKDYGNIKSFEIVTTETKNTVIDNYSQINYRVIVLVSYDKVQCLEKAGFKKTDNNPPKLEGYSFKEVVE